MPKAALRPISRTEEFTAAGCAFAPAHTRLSRNHAALCQIDRLWITSVKVVEILGGHVVSGLGRDFGEGGGLVVAEAIHCLLRHV
ncbi:MAG: hypothetical protein ABSA66_13885, partial [Roseiarcus sp.]